MIVPAIEGYGGARATFQRLVAGGYGSVNIGPKPKTENRKPYPAAFSIASSSTLGGWAPETENWWLKMKKGTPLMP